MHINSAGIAPSHRTAVLHSVFIVEAVTASDLDLPTPCAGWTVADLLAHMTVQHRGFAASVRGHGADARIWDPETISAQVRADPAGSYTAAARDALDAFSADGIDDAVCALPEFGPDATVPGAIAMAMHFVDYVVHGWDVAASLGLPFQLPDEVVAAALPIVLGIPDDGSRDAANTPFGHAVEAAGTTDLGRLLAHLGRRPDWSAQANSTVTGA
ncbi:TIGR03086 family metal-binding protein [Mycolicibacterium frederiksbergense]|uniref:TIGR03086 family protein n=1 Tax=Mycolicibacterium frederiksbergense TaxID=117567 RepID=A0A6H0S122_9MYCO|nr:TIGR03086 family metal-binding protein [Mycolicibacterium frederiksbergense]QIV80884.1 TIGR03086 family protein [Mycolicibacterium frederiksbergense]